MNRQDVLTVDVGNSSIGIGRHHGDRITLTRVSEPSAAADLLVGRVVGICVSTARWEALAAAVAVRGNASLQRLTGVPVPVVDARLALSAGADRLAAVLGALPGPAVIVDAGTAVTVDLVDTNGVFCGGFIAPGPGVALSGLKAGAPALPFLAPARLGGAVLEPGLDTEGALSRGTWGLTVGGVDRLVDAAFDALGAEHAKLLVTGGWGREWLAASRHAPGSMPAAGAAPADGAADSPSVWAIRWDEALVHRGIARWAEGLE